MNQLEPGKHICIATTAQIGQQNPIHAVHEMICLILVVDRDSGEIVDCDINTVCDLTRQFIRAMFIGKNLIHGVEEIRTCIQASYLGASAKAMVTAAKLARGKLLDHLKQENK